MKAISPMNDKLFRRLKQLVQMGVLSALLQCANTVAVYELSPVKDSALFWLACRNVLEGVAHTVAREFATGLVTRGWGVLVPNLAWDAYRAFITKDWRMCYEHLRQHHCRHRRRSRGCYTVP
jgi:hypothetical protein